MDHEKSLGRFIGRLHYQMLRKLNLLLQQKEAGITADQFRLLTHLWTKEGITQQELADCNGRDRAGITRMVDILEEQGITVRIPDREDRRINRIFLTEKGRNLERVAQECATEVVETVTKGFSEEEKTIFRTLLIRAFENFG